MEGSALLRPRLLLLVSLVVLAVIQISLRLGAQVEAETSGAVEGPEFLNRAVPDMELERLTEVEWDESECRLLYFFDVACPACEIGAGYWQDYAEPFPIPVHWIGFGETVARLRDYVSSRKIDVAVLRMAPEDDPGIISVPRVWGVYRDTIRMVDSGALSTSPKELIPKLSDWCPLPT